MAAASFSILERLSSVLSNDLEKNATGLPFWLRIADSAMLEASVSTTNGALSAMTPKDTSASSDFKSSNDLRASLLNEKYSFEAVV